MRWCALLAPLLLLGCQKSEDKPPDIEHVPLDEPEKQAEAAPASVDLYGDALPASATARLGSLRMVDRALANMVFSPDGSHLVANTDGGYAVWSVTDASRVRVLADDKPSPVIAMSPSGKAMATGRRGEGVVVLWDFEKGTSTYGIQGHTGEVRDLCFSSEDRLVSGGADGTVRLWDLKAREQDGEHAIADAEITAVACGKGGLVVFGTDDGEVYALGKGAKEPKRLGAAKGRINDIALAKGGVVAASSEDETIRVWQQPKPAKPLAIYAHERLVYSVALSPGGDKLYSTGGDWWFRVWDPATGDLIEEIPGIDGLEAQLMTLGAGGTIFASWSKHAGERGSEAGRWWLWNAAEGTLLLEPDRHREPVTAVAFSPDGKRLATASNDRTLRLWDAASGKQIEYLETAEGPINDLEWTGDGKAIFSAGGDALLSRWKLADYTETRPIEVIGGAVNAFDVSPDGKRVVTGDQIGRVWTWDLGARARIQAYDRGGYSAIYDVAYSPDGGRIAIAGSDRLVRVIDVKSGQEVAKLSPSADAASNRAVRFSPDGKLLATAGDDHHIVLWNTSNWKKERTLDGHDGTVAALAFSPDGKRLVSGGNDQMVRVWDVASGDELATFEGHQDVVTGVDVSPDGKRAASASRDRTALVWELP